MTTVGRRFLILQGHPDAGTRHFGHALDAAYTAGALAAGHEVRRVDVAHLSFPILRSKAEWEQSDPVPDIARAQADILWAEHLAIFFPLWMGDMPALLKAFLEQVTRPGFAVPREGSPGGTRATLAGRSARLVVTMGMPAIVYRWYYRAHGLKAMERGLLGMAGIRPVHDTIIGTMETMSEARRARWLQELEALGGRGE
jgi:putative NADPH-quinone reductase